MKRLATATLTADEKVRVLEAQVLSLQQQLDWFKQQLFGRKSEKRSPDTLVDQPLLNGFESVKPPARAVETETIEYTRRKHRDERCQTDAGLRFDDTVPVETIRCEPTELSGPNAGEYEVISEKVTHRLAQRSSYVVLKYVRPVLKHCPSERLVSTAAPAGLWEGSIVDVSLVSGLLTDKFVYHMPLYRQHQHLQRDGITVARESLTNWSHNGIRLLEPIYQAQLRNILRSRTLAIDETPIKAGRARKGRMHVGWYWPIYGDQDEVAFTYSPSRGHQHLLATLPDFEGTLLSDGYGAYTKFVARCEAIEHAQCWSHSRREFIRTEKVEPEAVAEALEHIGVLYLVEADIRKQALGGEDKRAYRQQHSVARVDAFFAWCEAQCQRMDLVPSNPLSKALKYVRRREDALRVYLNDPTVAIDTNHLERTLRAIPMGKKNWLFCWTEVGAQLVGIIQSLLTTCRLHGVHPQTYLIDVLQRVGQHPAKDIDHLTPRNWKRLFADNPLRSDVDRTEGVNSVAV